MDSQKWQLGRWIDLAQLSLPIAMTCLFLPKSYGLWFSASTKFAVLTSAIALLWWSAIANHSFSGIKSFTKESLKLYDGFFILWIALLLISSSWTSNPYLGIQMSMSWLAMYLLYRWIASFGIGDHFVDCVQWIIVIFTGLSVVAFSWFLWQGEYIDNSGKIRIHSELIPKYFVYHVNTFIYGLGLFIPSAYYLLLRSSSILIKILLIVLIALASYMIYGMYAQTTKLVIVLPILFFLRRLPLNQWFGKFRYSVIYGGLALFIVIGFVIAFNNRSFIREFDQLDSRYSLWEASVSVWLERPLFGYGAGDWIHQVYKFGAESIAGIDLPSAYYFYSHSHSIWFQTLVENGLTGIICVGFVLLWPLTKVISKVLDDDLSVLVLVSTIYYTVSASLYGFVFFQKESFAIGLPILMIQYGLYTANASPNSAVVSKNAGWCKLIMGIISIVCALWFGKNIYINKQLNIVFANKRTSIEEMEYELSQWYHPWLKTHFDNELVLSAKASRYLKAGRISEAFDIYDQVDQLMPNTFSHKIKMINLYIDKKAYKNALLVIDEAEQINSQFWPLKLAKLEALLKLNRLEEAEQIINQEQLLLVDFNRLSRIRQQDKRTNKRRDFYNKMDKRFSQLKKLYNRKKVQSAE